MERQPLDSLEYESTYLELRPPGERLSDMTDAPRPAGSRADAHVHDAAASNEFVSAGAGIAVPGPRTMSASPPDLSPRTAGRTPPRTVHSPAGLPARMPLLSTGRQWSEVSSRLLASPRRPRVSGQVGSSLLVVTSASLGLAAALDVRAARGLFVALTGVLLLGWARVAWRGAPRAEPFGAAATRMVDRLVTALGTFFAIALWAKYAPEAAAELSKTALLVLCGVGPLCQRPARRSPSRYL
jgi:hypothetical protein